MAAEGRLKRLWDEHEWTVKVVQGAAVLEIAHAALGLVRSPISRTFIQVFSRVAIVWGAHDPLYKYPFTPFPKPKGCELTLESGPECTEERNQQVIAVTLITWSIAELIRYSFYLFNTIDPKIVPFPIIWLRYTGEACALKTVAILLSYHGRCCDHSVCDNTFSMVSRFHFHRFSDRFASVRRLHRALSHWRRGRNDLGIPHPAAHHEGNVSLFRGSCQRVPFECPNSALRCPFPVPVSFLVCSCALILFVCDVTPLFMCN